MLQRVCKFVPSFPLFTQLIQQLLYSAGAFFSPSTSKVNICNLFQWGTKWREMAGGVKGGGGGWWGCRGGVWRGGMGRAGPGWGVWLGINQGTVGFLLLSCFEALCPGILHPSTPLLSFSLLLPLTLPPEWDSSSTDSCQVCGISLLGAP